MPANKTLFGTLANSLLTRMSRGRLPQTEGELIIPGITDSVEIIRDRWGIPHIYAQNSADAYFAQGFVHAQDRLFQMELNRRTAAGRLSEIFGEMTLNTDRVVRTFGFNRLGRTDWENATPEIKTTLSAYAAGVNAFIEHSGSKNPLELRILGHIPDPWEPQDSAIISRIMIWQMSHAWQGEILRAEIAEKVGVEHAAELEIHYPSSNPTMLPRGIEFNTLDPEGTLSEAVGPFLERGKGSNSWVTSPAKNESGGAVLANDIHLQLSLPSWWYEVHLHTEDGLQVTGASLPGIPMVIIGHNQHIAWGITLAYTDAEDLFVEQIDTQDPPRYLYQDEWYATEIIEEEIKIKKVIDPHIEHVIITRHGPIISDQVGYSAQKVAIQSMALRPVTALASWYQLNLAQGWDDFVDAMRLLEAPQLNFTYADEDGNIGTWITGRTPVRAKGEGSVPAPSWTGEYEWIGEIPFEEMPHALNPEQGYLINCNQKTTPPDYPHFLGNAWMNGYRARRLAELIEGEEVLSLQDHAQFQMDVKCLPGLELVTRLEGVTDPEKDVQLALKLLRGWDGHLTPESVGGAIYEVVRYTLVRELLDPGLGEELATRVMGVGFHPLLMQANEFFGHDTVVLLRLLDNPESWWVQQAGGHDILISRALKHALEWLRSELGPDETDWHWGKLHQVNFEHPLSLQKPFDQVFDRGPFPIGGDTDTPLQTAIRPGKEYGNRAWSPTYRQIIDMSDPTKAISMHTPGQSGQLASQHYDDFIEHWLQGEYHPMLWTREQVEAETRSRLILKSQHNE